MWTDFCFDWEISLMTWIQSFASDPLTAIMSIITFCGDEYFLVLVIGLCYWCVNKDLGHKVALALSGTIIFGTLLKGAVLRRRPYMGHSEIQCLGAAHPELDIMSVKDQGYSFPSLHAAMSATTLGSIAWNTKKKVLVVIAIIATLLIGISRVYLGVHYPTDVLVGWVLGIACIFILGAIEKKWGYKIGFAIVAIIGCLGLLYCGDSEFCAAFGVVIGMMAGFIFEEKKVNFEYCDKWWSYILRPLLGVLIFFALSAVLKIPVAGMSLEDGNMFLLLYRLARYAICAFVVIGVYPLLFKVLKNRF